MIDIDVMAKICKKCPNYRFKDSEQDDRDGCRLKQPLANCPHLLAVYKLPDKWADEAKKYKDITSEKWFYLGVCKCADALVEVIENG